MDVVLLRTLLTAGVSLIPDRSPSAEDRFEELLSTCESALERNVLEAIYKAGLPLPDGGQEVIAEGDEMIARPDFIYRRGGHSIAIFVDGPDHERETIKRDDMQKRGRLDLMGYTVLSIGYRDSLEECIRSLTELLE